MAWLLLVGVALVIGFVNMPNRGDWLRETNWMLFYAFGLPVGTLITTRRDLADPRGEWGRRRAAAGAGLLAPGDG